MTLFVDASAIVAMIGREPEASTFGKGRHPAGLNMGDCFAHACARSLGASILFKGDDFAQTDLIDGTLE